MQQSELDLGIQELQGVWSFGLLGRDNGGTNNLHGRLAGTVTRRKVSIHLADCCVQRDVTVFLVHVVGTTATVVSQPQAVGLDNVGILFKDLVNLNNFTIGALDLLQL